MWLINGLGIIVFLAMVLGIASLAYIVIAPIVWKVSDVAKAHSEKQNKKEGA